MHRVRSLIILLLILDNLFLTSQSIDEINKEIKVIIELKTGIEFRGAYHSHTEDSILILQPFREINKALRSKPSSNVLFSQFNFNEIERLSIYKKNGLVGFAWGTLIGAAIGPLVGMALLGGSDGFLSGPGFGAGIGFLFFTPVGGIGGAVYKIGRKRIYNYRSTKNTWSPEEYQRFTQVLAPQDGTTNRKLYFIAGVGYSSEVIHLGLRYYLDDFNDLSVHSSFILAATTGFGIDYRRNFGSASNSTRGAWFTDLGFSYKQHEDSFPKENTYYISFAFGKNFYFTPDTGLSIDLGYDYSLKDTDENRLKSYFGPRFQFFF